MCEVKVSVILFMGSFTFPGEDGWNIVSAANTPTVAVFCKPLTYKCIVCEGVNMKLEKTSSLLDCLYSVVDGKF
jgi:hypothetical protein